MSEMKEQEYRFKPEELACLEKLRTPLAVFQFLDKRVVTRVLSAGLCDLFEFDTPEEAYAVMTTDMYSTAHPDDASRVADEAYRFATGDGKFETVYRVKARRSSGYKIVHALGEQVFTETGERLAYVWFTDEGVYSEEDQEQGTELSRSFRIALREESMIRASYYDYLTGLPNMSHFFDLVEAGRTAALNKGETPAVLFIDLNGMRLFNMKHGFAEGDRLLVEVSKLLVRHFKSENCSRFGEDHFAVFTDAMGLENVLRSIMEECETLSNGRGISMRIGIYLDRIDDVEAGTACDRAQRACNTLPHSTFSSDYCYFDGSMLEAEEMQQHVLENLDRAIEEKWIQVHYQPIVRAVNGKVCYEEALARWNDPELGMLHPVDFVRTLEGVKQIHKLDLCVLEQLLEKIKLQREAELFVVPHAFNVSRADFDACDYVKEVCSRVDAAGVGRKLLVIEIKEDVISGDPEFMKAQVERFREEGFEVWIGNFGGGNATMNVLQDIRFDQMKLDISFMRRFNDKMENRIILTELIRMAIGLGIDTICVGVESKEQVEFLREVGCTKLQGYHFCKPISYEAILERYKTGKQIGFENPKEANYYASIGRINLFDTSIMAATGPKSLRHYFDSIPMALVETTDEEYETVRWNRAYHDYSINTLGSARFGVKLRYDETESQLGQGFLEAQRSCGRDGGQRILDEELPDGSTIHTIIKRVATNPVTGASTLVEAVLAIMNEKDENAGLTYANIAKALSTDYFDLFYVNLNTEKFIHYSSNAKQRNMTMERHGENFFQQSLEDGRTILYENDYPFFARTFTRENVVRALDEQGAFTLTYRVMMDGSPIYVNMKAVRMGGDDEHIIIGVNNVNTLMQERAALERIRTDRVTYSRIMALTGDFVCIYTVDPNTGNYVEFSAAKDFEGLGIAKEGEDFFADAQKNAAWAIYAEDIGMMLSEFTRDNILETVCARGAFTMNYRLMLNGEPTKVHLKAVLTEEKDGPCLIVGVTLAE